MNKFFQHVYMILCVGASSLSYGMEIAHHKEEQKITAQTNKANNLLTRAIDEGNLQKTQEAFAQGAEADGHGTYSDTDFAASDWTPLMDAVAELKNTLVQAQSAINQTGWFPGWFGTGAEGWFGSSAVAAIKNRYKPKIEGLAAIIKLLISRSKNLEYADYKGNTAGSICECACRLLESKTLYPPFQPRKPAQEYIDILRELQQQLPNVVFDLNNHSKAKPAKEYKQDKEFEAINADKPPIIYHEGYNVRAWGLQKFHPFDTEKYGKIAGRLKKNFVKNFYLPEPVTDDDLALVQTKEYIASLNNLSTIAEIAELDALAYLSISTLKSILLDPVRLAAGGTILGAELALKYGWAVNLSGGYHHAKSDRPVPGGFCFINDSVIAAKKVLNKDPNAIILIVDLDAHQGNGNAQAVLHESRIALFDVYNEDTWPGDVQKRINFDYPIPAKTKDYAYLNLVRSELTKAIDRVRPTLIIYNAGTDPLEGDPLGSLSLSKQGIWDRDEFVVGEAVRRKIPILMVLSGGYHPSESINTISGSIINLWHKIFNNSTKQK